MLLLKLSVFAALAFAVVVEKREPAGNVIIQVQSEKEQKALATKHGISQEHVYSVFGTYYLAVSPEIAKELKDVGKAPKSSPAVEKRNTNSLQKRSYPAVTDETNWPTCKASTPADRLIMGESLYMNSPPLLAAISHRYPCETRGPEARRAGVYRAEKLVPEGHENARVYIMSSGADDIPGLDERLEQLSALDDKSTDGDSVGNGIAIITGSEQGGVARNARLISVKVVQNGETNAETVLRGIQLISDRELTGDGFAVVYLGLETEESSSLDFPVDGALHSAIQALANRIPVVIPAGDKAVDACNSFLIKDVHGMPGVTIVGATTEDDSVDPKSNFGSCVDIWAPGEEIGIARGTQLAAALTVGVLSYWKTLQGGDFPSTESTSLLQYRGVKGRVTDNPSAIFLNNGICSGSEECGDYHRAPYKE